MKVEMLSVVVCLYVCVRPQEFMFSGVFTTVCGCLVLQREVADGSSADSRRVPGRVRK